MIVILRSNISVVMMILNEEYWLDYAIKPVADAGLEIFVGDTGSTDRTHAILERWEREYSHIHVFKYGRITAEENGKIREVLAHKASTPWILQVDGDEILTPEGVEVILNLDMGNWLGAMITQQVLKWDEENSCIRLANRTSHRRIHRRDAVWVRQYPYESTVDGDDSHERFYYPKGITGYHMKFLSRSSQDETTYKRVENNKRYWPYFNSLPQGEVLDLFDTIGPPRYPNPYWAKVRMSHGAK